MESVYHREPLHFMVETEIEKLYNFKEKSGREKS
jgi:hypothetical protein